MKEEYWAAKTYILTFSSTTLVATVGFLFLFEHMENGNIPIIVSIILTLALIFMWCINYGIIKHPHITIDKNRINNIPGIFLKNKTIDLSRQFEVSETKGNISLYQDKGHVTIIYRALEKQTHQKLRRFIFNHENSKML